VVAVRLLDTNVCIEVLRGRNEALRKKLAATNLADICLCSVVWAELYTGANLSHDPQKSMRQLDAFRTLTSYPFDDDAARVYGELRASLQPRGQLIGGNDMMIAAIALARGLIMITNNTSEFSRIPRLKIEDWQTG
jgi:tRNA(fMet)-specific endonuclease VapC